MPLIVTPSQLNKRAELYHQLGAMLSAGIPLLKSLEMLSVNPVARHFRKTLLQIIQKLQMGATFSQSMAETQGWLPYFDKALLAAGETSGRLDSSFKLLSVYYSSRAKILGDMIRDLFVTAATLHVFLFIFPLGLLVSFAKGILANDYAQCVPFIIEKVAVFGGIYVGLFLLIYLCQGTRGERWRSIVESIARCIPLLGTAQKFLVLSRLSAALEALIRSGVSVIAAWELAGGASGSPSLRRKINAWQIPLENGVTPAELVNQTRYFPEMFSNLYFSGEESGQLDDSLQRLQIYYQEEGFRLLRLFTRVLNGTIYGLVVLLVAFSVIGFYMSYYGAMMNNL